MEKLPKAEMAAGEIPSEEKPSVVKRAELLGLDLSLLRERLSWSPTERVRRHQEMLAFAERLREAGRRSHGRR